MIEVKLNWDAAREYVEQDTLLMESVDPIQRDLQSDVDEEGLDKVKDYLSTHYFDQTGYRYWELVEDAEAGEGMHVVNVMHRLTAVKIAQERIFGDVEAHHAFEDWKIGHHDT